MGLAGAQERGPELPQGLVAEAVSEPGVPGAFFQSPVASRLVACLWVPLQEAYRKEGALGELLQAYSANPWTA